MESGGYYEKSLQLLKKSGVNIGDRIMVETNDQITYGILIPRYEYSNQEHIVVKLNSGYNIGIKLSRIKKIEKMIAPNFDKKIEKSNSILKKSRIFHINTTESSGLMNNKVKSLPTVSLLSTGGTIASRIDYRTGAVSPALSAQDLYDSVPAIQNIAIIEPDILFSEYSENLGPRHWTMIAERVTDQILSGKYNGIIISHGTDTMHYTAAALSFSLQNSPIPIIIVGSQRSSDRPSSDAFLNLLGATTLAAKCDFAGIYIAMHKSSSDNQVACHLGTRVRKNHSSRRDAFQSIDISPIALVEDGRITRCPQYLELEIPLRDQNRTLLARPKFDDRVMLFKFYPGFDPNIIGQSIELGKKILIFEGTGLGHISSDCFHQISKAIDLGALVFMTSQCIWGQTAMTVYNTGRDLMQLGVEPLSNMISETATVKAMWALANYKVGDIKKVMTTNIANEITPSRFLY